MTRAELLTLEDEASAAMAIRGDWERAYRRNRTRHNWRELQTADAHATALMGRLKSARRTFAASERELKRAARIEAELIREAAQHGLQLCITPD